MSTVPDYWSGILIAYLTFIVATVSPGPALLATMGTAMGAGRRAGAALGMGVVCGSFTWGVLAALGLSAVLASYAGALEVIRILGCLYLLFLAWKAFRSAATRDVPPAGAQGGARRSPLGYFLRGWGIHLTNPKAILAWIAIISLGLKPGAPPWVAAAIVGGTMVFAVCFYTLAAVAFSTPAMVRFYGRARRWIDGFLGVFYTFAAFRLASR
ncbi:LysE family translocator [Arenibaculum sp.]|jgi:threonine/homoserine/homoserine lactone efflux protein|uniref:LysE family translocator n=1 Tax=Arenibaculum sp. TaxID=2865862 RepID=UPI002E0D5737|nr:LysE family translocator [Arenibaculum sp.]